MRESIATFCLTLAVLLGSAEISWCADFQKGEKKRMRLPDNAIRGIIKLLKDGKPLPDKYGFTLFGQKRELELIWNGKTNKVTNVVLPFQTIENVDERRPGKELKPQSELFDLATGSYLKG